MNIAIVGGGIMGITLAYHLTKAGISVDVYEASPTLGGLAGPMRLQDGVHVDRFYHAILSSDDHLRHMCDELDVVRQLRFRQTRTGFYHQGQVYPMNGIGDFLRFPPLNWLDRVRLGWTILAAQRVRDWHELEQIGVEEWLTRLGGRNTFQNIWRPLLRAKFDSGFDDVPATWIWARLVRMKSTRRGPKQREEAGHLVGGYITLVKRMADIVEAAGGHVFTQAPVEELVISEGRLRGLRVQGALRPYRAVVGTMQSPIFCRLLAGEEPGYVQSLLQQQYLGIVCPLMVLERPLTGYWTINITDDTVPFTGIIETTAYIDSADVGGHHLVYLPKYTASHSEWLQRSDADIRTIWFQALQRMFPSFATAGVREFIVQRERYVEPLHDVNGTDRIPALKTPISGLYHVTTAQIYPELTNGESVTRHAYCAATTIVDDLVALRADYQRNRVVHRRDWLRQEN